MCAFVLNGFQRSPKQTPASCSPLHFACKCGKSRQFNPFCKMKCTFYEVQLSNIEKHQKYFINIYCMSQTNIPLSKIKSPLCGGEEDKSSFQQEHIRSLLFARFNATFVDISGQSPRGTLKIWRDRQLVRTCLP